MIWMYFNGYFFPYIKRYAFGQSWKYYTLYNLWSYQNFKCPSGHVFDMPLEEDDIQITDGYFKYVSYNWNVDGTFTKPNFAGFYKSYIQVDLAWHLANQEISYYLSKQWSSSLMLMWSRWHTGSFLFKLLPKPIMTQFT